MTDAPKSVVVLASSRKDSRRACSRESLFAAVHHFYELHAFCFSFALALAFLHLRLSFSALSAAFWASTCTLSLSISARSSSKFGILPTPFSSVICPCVLCNRIHRSECHAGDEYSWDVRWTNTPQRKHAYVLGYQLSAGHSIRCEPMCPLHPCTKSRSLQSFKTNRSLPTRDRRQRADHECERRANR